MKFFSYVFILLISSSILAQTSISSKVINSKSFDIAIENINLDYKEHKIGNYSVRDYFFINEKKGFQKKDLIIAIPPNSLPSIKISKIENIKLKNTILNFSNDSNTVENKFIPKNNIYSYNNEVEVLGYFWYKNVYCAHIKYPVLDFLAESNTLIEYKNVTLSIEFDKDQNLRLTDQKNSKVIDKNEYSFIANKDMLSYFKSSNKLKTRNLFTNWMNENSRYIKLGISKDGLYRFYANSMSELGINQVVSIDKIELYESGINIPFKIEDKNNNLFFDANDYIEFFGTKNYSKEEYFKEFEANESYIPYLNRYSDTSFYFFTWGNKKGEYIQIENKILTSISDTLDFYQNFMHLEENKLFNRVSVDNVVNQDPFWTNTDLWQWRGLGIGSASFSFDVSDLLLGKQASIYSKIVGAASDRYTNSHNLSISCNSTMIDSQSIDRNQNVILGNMFNSNVLSNGQNFIKINNYENGSSVNSIVFDWYEVNYPKKLIAIDDSLIFQFKDSNIDTKAYTIKIENFNSDSVIIYQLAPRFSEITNYSINNFTIYFSDTVSTLSKYLIVSEDKILPPKIYGETIYKNLLHPEVNTNYLILTHEALFTPSIDYSNFIKEEYNVETNVIDVKDIFNEFSFGYPDPIGIKNYLHHIYGYWDEPNLDYVFIIGNASYDTKNYLSKNVNKNLVPSFGEPVSDVWYTIWDSTGASVPQLSIGRLSAKNESEVYEYLNKHKKIFNDEYDEFNKRALFFSGGDGNNSGELEILKNVNDFIIENYARSEPLSLQTSHFYKTVNPKSDFGPFEYDYINNEIKKGGVFISYIGHSGTRTWDNSISQPEQLNNLSNKSSLVTDFGCSTNKFAEPDIDCFSTLFLREGIGIAYIGNSSLGFLTTAVNVSKYFYESILIDSIYTLGNAHNESKMKLLTRLGTSGIYKIFVYTNQLAGDPIISLPLPKLPNLQIKQDSIIISKTNISEIEDSVKIQIPIYNFGIASKDSFDISIIENWNGLKYHYNLRNVVPDFKSIQVFNAPTKGRIGKHDFEIYFDSENKIKEISENDNFASFSFNVTSSQIRSLITNINSLIKDSITFINPTYNLEIDENIFEFEISKSSDFENSNLLKTSLDTLFTQFSVGNLENHKRYWIRNRISNNQNWNAPISFTKNDNNLKYFLNDSLSISFVDRNNLDGNNLKLSKDSVIIEVQSSGGDVAKYGAIFRNGINVLPNTFSWGMGIAVFDSIDMSVDTAMTVWYGDNSSAANQLANFILSIPDGKIVAMNVIDDGKSNLTSDLKTAIKTLGSSKVDSISFRGPWALISTKGSAEDNILEIVENRSYENVIIISKKYNILNGKGSLIVPNIGPSSTWNNIIVRDSLLNNSKITYKPILISQVDYSEDTLDALNFVNGEASLNFIDAKKYPYIKLLAEFEAGDNNTSPELYSLGVDYVGIPELAINYQVVSVEKDTVNQGEDANLQFYVYNVGESRADSFQVKVEVVKQDNSKEKIFETLIDSLGSEKRKKFNITYSTANFNGPRTFSISIDTENKVTELYEDNNFFNIPFYVVGDTTQPSLKLTFDGNDIFDGEYISNQPNIKIELTDPSLVPITDTSSVNIFLNNNYIHYLGNENILNVNYSESNPKVTLNYTPTLEDGEYTLRVFGKDASGNVADSGGIRKSFIVQSDPKLLNVYNYPNPITNDTYFTFKLTQIPDEIKIKVFTIAGRLIKEIELNRTQLNYDLNKIYWDGRDDDGDLIGNGVYLYKVIMDVAGKKQDVTQKLAVVR
ncbi:MAG: hypothetical protein H6611_02930 [Ignavibacteriales bacterium]|nr:hypothetical protein [Ignavibacteriales bacterium]MCB9209107.1 hypothetical protein [Ignavibacteriales bacterium]